MQLSKSQRRNQRRAYKRAKDAWDVHCQCGKFLGRRKIDTIDKRFPGGFKHRDTFAHGLYIEVLGKHCPLCYPARLRCPAGHITKVNPREAKRCGIEAALGELVDWHGVGCEQCREEEHQTEQERLEKLRWIDYTFRPDQGTYVVVHDVCFQWERLNGVAIAAASFQGKVVNVRLDVDEPTVTVQLAVRRDLHFRYVSPVPPKHELPIAGLRMRRNLATGLFEVVVPASKLSVDSQYIVAGGKCKATRCDETCERHTLRPVVVLSKVE